MGVFSFIKEAGNKVFGIDKEKVQETAEVSDQQKSDEGKEDRKAAKRMKEIVEDLDLKIKDLQIDIEGDMVRVSGKAADQPTKEKVVLLVGNTKGIARVDDKIEVEKEGPEAIFHTVERDDNLSKIAKKHYGDANKYLVIFEANKPVLQDPDNIYPGQVLRIPRLEKQ